MPVEDICDTFSSHLLPAAPLALDLTQVDGLLRHGGQMERQVFWQDDKCLPQIAWAKILVAAALVKECVTLGKTEKDTAQHKLYYI